jgi:WD40 repeat protein
MSSNDPTGIKRSAEEALVHDNAESGRDGHQPSLDSATLPMNLITGSILPFVQDRLTWNNVCVANKESRDASRTMTPPWPETTLQQSIVNYARTMVFSPCGHYLACGTVPNGTGRNSDVEILDRRTGQQISFQGQIDHIRCLTFSGDGKYLAAGGTNGLIRIWPTSSTGKPGLQEPKTLQGHQWLMVQCLAFASDSNLLASGSYGGIRLWDVEEGVSIHNFDQHERGMPSSLVFSGVGESIRCLAARNDGSLIRISRNNSHSEFTSDCIVFGATPFKNSVFSNCGSSLLATVDSTNELCLYEVKPDHGVPTMIKSITLPAYCGPSTNDGMTFSPDNKTLAIRSDNIADACTEVRLLNVKDLTLLRQLNVKDLTLLRQVKWQLGRGLAVSLAFDPSSRYLATAFSDGILRLWTL